jgi:hypothetical protein
MGIDDLMAIDDLMGIGDLMEIEDRGRLRIVDLDWRLASPIINNPQSPINQQSDNQQSRINPQSPAQQSAIDQR